MRKVFYMVDWMIPKRVKHSSYTYRKARILSFMHLFLLVVAISLSITTFLINPENQAAFFSGIFSALLFIWIFKKWGNFIISGNLLALLFPIVLVPSVFETGGLYSDNLLWLLGTPLLALLFANRLSGVLWTMSLVGFTGLMFYLENNALVSFREQTLHFNSEYYLISYTTFFIVVVSIVLIFAKGQEQIIKALIEKQRELEHQKKEISRQANQLKNAEEKLMASNKELEHFAYAASHDLKEPLRMIGIYTQLIEKKLKAHLEQNTQEYMGYVTSGVNRMDRLLNDLLEYSRLGKDEEIEKPTDLNDTIFVVMNNLMASMEETDATILSNKLPIIESSQTAMIQLFQNLLANAIKFRQKETKPVIQINHALENGHHLISVKDNGIGIKPEHQNKVFGIFERLHRKDEYDGSGIGLATCKKIVNSLGGKIWVNSSKGHGTTFYFTFPKSKGRIEQTEIYSLEKAAKRNRASSV